MEQHLSIWDLVLTPLYLVGLIFVAKRIRNKHYPVGHPLRQYYLPGLYVKFGGAIFIALIYQYYYSGGGDTFNFFIQSKTINSILDDSLSMWAKVLFRTSPETDPYIYKYSSQLYWYTDRNTYTVGAIGAVIGLFNGTTYLPISLVFAFLSFTGIWAMFKTFVSIYPNLHKPLAVAFLFIPSTVVWGSAMFKDTICMFGLGWLTYTTFRIFVNGDFSTRNLLLMALSFYLIALVKVYILVAFVPALCIWLLVTYSRKIRSSSMRWFVNILTITSCVSGLIFLSQSFASSLGRYSLENLANTAKSTQGYINYVSEIEGGSAYDLGEYDPTLTGMISKFPQAVTVTLFRPFLWEAKKPIMLLSAFESFAFLALFLYVLFGKGIKVLIKQTAKDPNMLFFLIYSLIFAFAVGISTGNFGSLSRYKIPCMPFFAAFLLILFFKNRKTKIKKSIATDAKEPVHNFA